MLRLDAPQGAVQAWEQHEHHQCQRQRRDEQPGRVAQYLAWVGADPVQADLNRGQRKRAGKKVDRKPQ